MSTRFILRNFTLNRDFHAVSWLATIWYNGLRSLAAGLVIMTLYAFVSEARIAASDVLYVAFLWPFYYALFLLPIGLVASKFANSWILAAMGQFAGLVGVAVGDPVVRLLSMLLPRFVPVRNAPFFSTSIIFFVLNQPEIVVANESGITQ